MIPCSSFVLVATSLEFTCKNGTDQRARRLAGHILVTEPNDAEPTMEMTAQRENCSVADAATGLNLIPKQLERKLNRFAAAICSSESASIKDKTMMDWVRMHSHVALDEFLRTAHPRVKAALLTNEDARAAFATTIVIGSQRHAKFEERVDREYRAFLRANRKI